ncbi:hypothetical protein TNCV_2048781 [Trichonephila clavipes]|nr:hypothetical protein TNCV_2048781 [Trichonephila clavipes]
MRRNVTFLDTTCCSTEGELLMGSMSVFSCSFQYASTHHGAQQGEAACRSSDMRQARHLPQRWYWSIVLQVRCDPPVHLGHPNCNTNPKANCLWYSKRTRIGNRRTNHQPIDRSGLTPASRLRRSMGQRARNRNPRFHFPRHSVPRGRASRTHPKVSPEVEKKERKLEWQEKRAENREGSIRAPRFVEACVYQRQ